MLSMRISILLVLLAAFFSSTLSAQNNASSYYRKFAAEQKKIRTKQVMYYKGALSMSDARLTDKNRGMVVTQIVSSQKAVAKLPPFQGDSALRNDYRRILAIYLEAYTTAFDSVQIKKSVAGKSAANLVAYRESIANMEGLVDEAEDMWDLNENYFSNTYTISLMEDPTLAQLTTLRNLADYVLEIRGCYQSLPFLLTEIQSLLKTKKYSELEEKREALSEATDRALVTAGRVGAYFNEKEKEDDLLLNATLRYLDELKISADDDMTMILNELDEAIYNEDDKDIEKAVYNFEKLLEDLVAAEEDLNNRAEKFVSYYVKD
jgi:hypothetical protein